ncbi:MAG: hypothetical protein WAZ27_05155 [Minisyncoccia bacterium]
MDAPSPYILFSDFRSRLIQIHQETEKINSMDGLVEVKQKYLLWLFDLWDFIEKHGLIARAIALRVDKVVKHSETGGAGLEFGDDRSWDLFTSLKEETKSKITILDSLAPAFGTRILEKRADTFYYCGKPVRLSQNSTHYHLLDVLFTYGNDSGMCFYEDIVSKLNERCDARKLGKTTREISNKTIANALRSLFAHSYIGDERLPKVNPSGKKLIEPIYGKGLVLNNELII